MDLTQVLQMSFPRVAIVVVQRERYSPTLRCLSQLIAVTPVPLHLIYVDGGSPPSVQAFLRCLSQQYPWFEWIRRDRPLGVNEARNEALARLSQEKLSQEMDCLLFMDNDIWVEPGWLAPLVTSAEQEEADVVAPLVLDGDGQTPAQQVHIAGLSLNLLAQPDGTRILQQQQMLHRQPLPRQALQRQVCGGVEAHCFLVRRELLARLSFDPAIDEPFGYLDLSLQLQRQGCKVVVEPQSQVTFLNPQLDPSFEAEDSVLYRFRWNDRNLQATRRYMVQKWNLSPRRSGLEGVCRWAVANRQLPLKRSAPFAWRWLLQGSKLRFCPGAMRDSLESYMENRLLLRLIP